MVDLIECKNCSWTGYPEETIPKHYEQYKGDTTKSFHCPKCDGCKFNEANYLKITLKR